MYECHITVEATQGEHETLNKIAEDFQWKTSHIQNDPLLGKKPYFYFTCHHMDYNSIFGKMVALRSTLFVFGKQVVREKIEHIVYDTKKTLVANG